MIDFIVGLVLGVCVGIVIIAICSANGDDRNE